MRIGIDIDNTLTEIQDELNKAAYEYAISLGKDINSTENNIEDIKNNGDLYKKKFKFSYDELKFFLKNIQEDITNKAIPREGVIEVINDLKKDGHEIYIVTARDSEFHDDPYQLSKNWLDKNNIYYDKLIVNARKKAPVCIEEKIDIFIDDQLNNCIDASNVGIKAIRITNEITEYPNVLNVQSWKQIYGYIKEIK